MRFIGRPRASPAQDAKCAGVVVVGSPGRYSATGRQVDRRAAGVRRREVVIFCSPNHPALEPCTSA